ncbi:glutaredoxin [Escherichia phage FP43]|uniref:Glutaredoxin n=1 Tax=Escherichia phage FP43 TaxID=2666261 RepID=A0A650FB71_9CAUD|nr:glutaredoxin [Escherichia phage FP43]
MISESYPNEIKDFLNSAIFFCFLSFKNMTG